MTWLRSVKVCLGQFLWQTTQFHIHDSFTHTRTHTYENTPTNRKNAVATCKCVREIYNLRLNIPLPCRPDAEMPFSPWCCCFIYLRIEENANEFLFCFYAEKRENESLRRRQQTQTSCSLLHHKWAVLKNAQTELKCFLLLHLHK